ncbi:hypothetical protein D3C87_2070720 [compost metagenome]
MEMHCRLGHAGRTGGEAKQRHVVSAGLYRLELHRLVQSRTIEFSIVIGCAVEADHLSKSVAFLGGGNQLIH